MSRLLLGFAAGISLLSASHVWGADPPPDYTETIAPLLQKYCAGCHNEADREGGLALDSFALLQQGGDTGPALLPGQADSSRLIRVLTGAAEPKMPPEDNPAPTPDEIELLRAWIEGGARGPEGAEPQRRTLKTPDIPSAPEADATITSLALSHDGARLATARFATITLSNAQGEALHTLGGLPGKVNRLHFSQQGDRLIAASGVAGLYGHASLWDVATGQQLREFIGHADSLYDAELSPDGRVLATCSYDRQVILWDVETGEPVRTLEGHNGAVYDVAFHHEGKVLASASADETVKLWDIASGQRLDTLSQPEEEQYVVTFSPDGQHVLAGGADNRIRVWRFVSRDRPQINPLLYARFAHEGPITALAFSPDGRWLLSASEDRSIKLWSVSGYLEQHRFEPLPTLITGLVVRSDPMPHVLVSRLDGQLDSLPLGDLVTREPSRAADSERPLASSAVVQAGPMQEMAETEPNNKGSEAQTLALPATVTGVIDPQPQQAEDVDVFQFEAAEGSEWVFEIQAAQQQSPLDSYLEVLDTEGQPIERVKLQAIRDSYFTFRGKDSDTSDDFRVHNWEEMELNEFLYTGGEVVKLWLYPRGPDSGFKVYPGTGKRYTYFDTTAVAHALGEPCYIVEPHPPRAQLIPNGLPVFTLYYENDDDSRRRMGADSRLTFTAPRDGNYLVRVSDARGFGGSEYKYSLMIRPRRPDFRVTLAGADPTVSPGSAREFTVTAERLDDFEGPIQVDIDGLPPGFQVTTPVIIEAGQNTALGVISAAKDAPPPTPENTATSTVRASAEIRGQTVTKDVNSLGTIKLGAAPQVYVRIVPAEQPPSETEGADGSPWELVIRPGTTVTAKVVIERNGHEALVDFGKEDSGRNLPHGVFIDNIGLNGLMILEGQTERTFFVTAAKWVPEGTRLFHLLARVDGNQASLPVMLRVER